MILHRMALAGLALAACASISQVPVLAGGTKPKPAPAVLAEFEQAGAKTPAFDIRWAGEQSVFVTTTLEQVAEHELAAGLPVARQVFPSPREFDRGMNYGPMGVSAETLVVGSLAKKIAWRPLARNPGGTVLYERHFLGQIEDLDLQGDRLAWIGWPVSINQGSKAQMGGIAWVDRLSDALESPQQLLADTSGAHAGRHLEGCYGLKIGALRFQPDGSLLIAPGFVNEIALFDPAGHNFRRWDARLFGIDTAAACGEVSEKLRLQWNADPLASRGWVNKHVVIDEAIATPRGPAIIVRTMKDRLPTWRLHLLGALKVESFDLPLRAKSPYDRLAADPRGSRLAVLLSDLSGYPHLAGAPNRVTILSLPNELVQGDAKK